MDRFDISLLLSYYGSLLTEKQNELLTMHYDEDLSYGEISEIIGISRQAVLDSINKGVKHLKEIDSKLNLIQKDNNIKSLLNELSLNTNDSNQKQLIYQIQHIMED